MTKTVLQLSKIGKGNYPLLNEMTKAGDGKYRTLVCYLSGEPNSNNKIDDFVDRSIYMGLKKKQLKWTRPKTLRAVANLIDEEKVDLLVCQFRRPIAIGLLAAKLSKRKPKVVGILHGIVGGKVGLGRKLFNFFAYRNLSSLVSVSKIGVKDILRMNWKIDEEKVRAIHNGIDFSPFLTKNLCDKTDIFGPQYKDTVVFGSVGRLSGVKNLDRMIRGFAVASKENARIRLVIVGKGPDEDSLKALVSSLDLETKVHFLGYRNDVPQVLAAMDVYVMPSLREGLPLGLLEAMSSCLPVITSNRSGMKEIVSDAACGKLIDPENVSQISDAFEELASASTIELGGMGITARQRALDNFSAARMAKNYGNLYNELLGG